MAIRMMVMMKEDYIVTATVVTATLQLLLFL